MKKVVDEAEKKYIQLKNKIIRILSRDTVYPHSIIREKLELKENKELIDVLFNHLITEINNLNVNMPVSTYRYLEKIFTYLQFDYHSISEENFKNIINKLNEVENVAKRKKEKNNKIFKGSGDINNTNEFLDKITSKVLVTKNFIKHIKESNNDEETTVQINNFIEHLVYDVKNVNYIKELINAFPVMVNSYDENNTPLFKKIIQSYI